MKYEYKSISLSPDGIRVKGDDASEKLASMIDKECAPFIRTTGGD